MHMRGIRVLIVSSELAEGEFLATELTASLPPGARVQAVGTLAHALGSLKESRAHLVIVDLALPDSRGLETITALRAACGESSIIARARADQAQLSLAAVRAGADDCVVGTGRCAGALLRAATYALERLRRRTRERASRRALRFGAIGRFTFAAAHHFNELLTVIVGNAHLVLESTAPGGERARQLRDLLEAADRATLLIRQMTRYCDELPHTPRAVDVNELLREFEPLLRDTLGDLELSMEPGIRMESVSIDRSALEQALILGALGVRAAAPDRGRLTISTRLVDTPDGARAQTRHAPRSPHVVIRIEDVWRGPRPARHEVSSAGLAAVRGAVQRAGGLVEFETSSGGDALSILLPTRAAVSA